MSWAKNQNAKPCPNCGGKRGGKRPPRCLAHSCRMCEINEACTLAEHPKTEPCETESRELIWDHVP